MVDRLRRRLLKASAAAAAAAAATRGVFAQQASIEWGRGVEGQRKADLGNGTFLNPILAGDHPDAVEMLIQVDAPVGRYVELAMVGRDDQRRVAWQARGDPEDQIVHFGRREPPGRRVEPVAVPGLVELRMVAVDDFVGTP